jgi:hypothetical protein
MINKMFNRKDRKGQTRRDCKSEFYQTRRYPDCFFFSLIQDCYFQADTLEKWQNYYRNPDLYEVIQDSAKGV